MKVLPRNQRAGFTLFEIVVTIGILSGLLGAFGLSLKAATGDEQSQVHLAIVRERGEKALREIRQVLSQVQFVSGFPQTFNGNTIGTTYAVLAHGAADVPPGVPAPRELAFLVPADADDDGWPDTTTSGSLAWAPNPSAITIEGNGDGTNRLRLVKPNGVGRTLARGIRSVVFDTTATAGFALPLHGLQVTVYMDRARGRSDLPPLIFRTTLLLSTDDLLP